MDIVPDENLKYEFSSINKKKTSKNEIRGKNCSQLSIRKNKLLALNNLKNKFLKKF